MKQVTFFLIIVFSMNVFAQDSRFGLGTIDLNANADLIKFPGALNSKPLNISQGSYALDFKNRLSVNDDVDAFMQSMCFNSELKFGSQDSQLLDETCREEKSIVRKQLDTCRCLTKNHTVNLFPDITPYSNESYALERLKSLMDDFRNRSEYSHNMMIIQAQSMGEDLAIQYGLNQRVKLDEGFVGSVKDNIKESIKEGLKDSYKGGADFDKKLDEVMQSSGVGQTSVTAANILRGIEVPGESCLPMKGYLFMSSFPRQTHFWESITSKSSYKDWNIDELKVDLSRASTKNEKELLKSKIEFLEKNPLVKLVLSSENKEAAAKVFDVLKKYLSGMSCKNDPDACFRNFIKNGEAYKKDMGEIFKQPEMIALIQKKREEDVKRQISGLVVRSLDGTDIKALNSWAEREHGVSYVDCKLQFFGLNYTDSNDALIKQLCAKKLPELCQSIMPELSRAASAEIYLGDANEVIDIYTHIGSELNPDPMSNWNYKNDSDYYCNNHKRIHNGRSVTFNDFKKTSCDTKEPASFCSDRSNLFRAFMAGGEDENQSDKNYYGTSPDIMNDIFRTTDLVNDLPKHTQKSFNFDDELGAISSFIDPRSEQKLNASSTDSEVIKDSLNVSDSSFFTSESDSIFSPVADAGSMPISHSVNNGFNYIVDNAKEAREEVEADIKATKEAIAYNRERLERPNTTPEFRSEMEERLRSLEAILAEKEKNSQQYQNLISKLIDSQSNSSSNVASIRSAPTTTGTDLSDKEASQKVASSSAVKANAPALKNTDQNEEAAGRAPASVEAFSTSGGVQGGAGSVSSSLPGSRAAARSREVNSALLSKYGITVQESDDSVQIAPDKERRELSQLLSNANKSDIGIEVSKSEYDKFKNYDINALNKLYEERLEQLDTEVVKLLIHSDGAESLEFYAIKEDGRVVFQPVRKSKLTDLQETLKQY